MSDDTRFGYKKFNSTWEVAQKFFFEELDTQCGINIKGTEPIFHVTLRLMIIHDNAQFGCK